MSSYFLYFQFQYQKHIILTPKEWNASVNDLLSIGTIVNESNRLIKLGITFCLRVSDASIISRISWSSLNRFSTWSGGSLFSISF